MTDHESRTAIAAPTRRNRRAVNTERPGFAPASPITATVDLFIKGGANPSDSAMNSAVSGEGGALIDLWERVCAISGHDLSWHFDEQHPDRVPAFRELERSVLRAIVACNIAATVCVDSGSVANLQPVVERFGLLCTNSGTAT